MNRKSEKNILRVLFVFGIFSFLNLIRKPPMKDWLIIFFLKSYISSILDTIVVRKGYVQYPVKLSKTFGISFLFDYLLFPIACIYYNQVTMNGKIKSIILKVLYFSVPMTLGELWLEKHTKIVKYKKGWNFFYTFSSLSGTFIFVRFIIQLIRLKSSKEKRS